MKASWHMLALLASLFVLGGAAIAEPRSDQCIILVSVDGLADFYLSDPHADMPTVARLAREGVRGHMVCSFPTVTWPNHTSLVTGATPRRHGVIGNSYFDRQERKPVQLLVDPVFDKDQTVRVPTVYDAAHQAGLKTCGICWPATRNARTLDWQVPDMGGDSWERYGTKSWLEELQEEGLPVERQGPWVLETAGGVQRDWLYTRMAEQVLRKHGPNLILIHLVEPDHVQHRFGPRSPEAYWCVNYADDRIRDLVEAVGQSQFAGRTTIFVCGDHGFMRIDHDVRPNVLLRKLGLIELAGGKVSRQAAWSLSQGGGAAVYVLDESRHEIISKLRGALAKLEGVQGVFSPDEFDLIGQPTREQDPRAPDLWLAADAGYSFSDSAAGEEAVVARKTVGGTHGFLPDQPDLLSACVVWGPGITPGKKLGKVNIVQVAPTIAQILGVALTSAEGKPLSVR